MPERSRAAGHPPPNFQEIENSQTEQADAEHKMQRRAPDNRRFNQVLQLELEPDAEKKQQYAQVGNVVKKRTRPWGRPTAGP